MARRPLVRIVAVSSFTVLLAAGCQGEEGSEPTTFPNSPSEPARTPSIRPERSPTSPTPPALPESPPRTSGAPGDACVQGWVTPKEGTPDFSDPIGIIRRTSRFAGDYEVVDMRLFVGPESPPSDKNYITDIRRWYIKLFAVDDIAYQGRFLVEERRFGRGVAAVAPYDTEGFSSPDWVGFQWEEDDERARRYEGLPGRWRGSPYDFVAGESSEEGLTIPGLPAELVGCLEGT